MPFPVGMPIRSRPTNVKVTVARARRRMDEGRREVGEILEAAPGGHIKTFSFVNEDMIDDIDADNDSSLAMVETREEIMAKRRRLEQEFKYPRQLDTSADDEVEAAKKVQAARSISKLSRIHEWLAKIADGFQKMGDSVDACSEVKTAPTVQEASDAIQEPLSIIPELSAGEADENQTPAGSEGRDRPVSERLDKELLRRIGEDQEKGYYKLWDPLSLEARRQSAETHTDKSLDTAVLDRTIHVLGMGPVGMYIAHSLASLPHAPPITLLMHRPLAIQQYHDEGAAINIIRGDKLYVQSGFHVECASHFRRENPNQDFPGFGEHLEHTAEPPTSIIDTVIVTTQPSTTVSALKALKHRLLPTSTICFVQDGLGIIEKVSAEVFPDQFKRPAYVLANINTRLVSTELQYTIIEQREGVFTCSKQPRKFVTDLECDDAEQKSTITRRDFSWTVQDRHLVGTLAQTPSLQTTTMGHKSFYQMQLRALAVGAVIGPLSVLFDCSNDKLLYNYSASRAMAFLLEEISAIICALPEVNTIRNIEHEFSVQKLQKIVMGVLIKTGKNTTRMLQDVRAGRRTDIEFYNGYLAHRAKELGIKDPNNEMVLHMVNTKYQMKARERNAYIPWKARDDEVT